MPSIIFNPDTNTNSNNIGYASYPPTSLLNSELKKCFKDASIIFNKHLELYPKRWNYSESATGSAYLNLVAVLYCKITELRFASFGEEEISTRDLHRICRYLHKVALDYYQVQMNLLDEAISFERISKPYISGRPFLWEYSTGGLQMLRNYELMSYDSGEVLYSGDLENFITSNNIALSTRTEEVELKITKKLQVNDTEVEIPETVEPEVLSASIDLIKLISSSLDNYSISPMGCKDEIKILRRGMECDVTSLSNRELSSLAVQLEASPSLLRKIIKLGMGNGSI